MKRSILTLCLLGQVLFLWAQNQYYVAPNGNDNHDGSFQKPFQTIERAQLEARKAQGETTIYLRKGIYRLAGTPFNLHPRRRWKRETIIHTCLPQ